jgi:hypothetical protein
MLFLLVGCAIVIVAMTAATQAFDWPTWLIPASSGALIGVGLLWVRRALE